ncbi:MAG: MOP flippase family protein, partial [Caldilineaceae bacterium]|nr:MOP flippase family protein [Caldilineaceae bacterium]
LARLLTPADFGLMSMAVVVTGFAQAFADFGLSNAIIYKQDASQEQLSTLYWLNLLVGILIFAIIWLVTPLVVAYYQESRLVSVLQWSAATFLIIPIGQQFDSLLRRELRFRTQAIIQIVAQGVYLVASVSLAWLGYGVMSLVWGLLARAGITAALQLAVAIRSHWLPKAIFRLRNLGEFVRFGFFQMGEQSFAYITNNVDYLIIGRFLGAEPLGYYTLAYNLMRLPLSFLNPIVTSVAFPSFARMKDDLERIRQGYAKILHYLSALVLPLMTGLALTAPMLIPLLYGDQWLPAVPIVQVFALLGAWRSLSNPIGSLLLARGRADLGFYLNVARIFLLIIANLIGVQWGAIGVAISTCVAALVTAPLVFYFPYYLVQFPIARWWRSVRLSLLAALVLVVFYLAAFWLLNWIVTAVGITLTSIITLAFIVPLSALSYLAVLWRVDKMLLMEIWGILRPRTSVRTEVIAQR